MLILAHSLFRFICQRCVDGNTGHSLFRFIWQSCVDGNTGTLSISVYLAEMC